MNINKTTRLILLVLLFVSGVIGGYFYFAKIIPGEKASEGLPGSSAGHEELFSLRIYYPVENHLQTEERRIPRKTGQISIAEAVVQEYLQGPSAGTPSYMPKDVKILGIYKGADRILYINLSDEFRRNFQGDAIAEFLLLKGLYESLISNVEDIQDVKVLLEGKEVETLGGHLHLLYPLKDIVSYEY